MIALYAITVRAEYSAVSNKQAGYDKQAVRIFSRDKINEQGKKMKIFSI